MAKSKFWGVKNKAKQVRNKSVNDMSNLPKEMEVNEALIEQQQNAPAVSEDELKGLLDSLNDIPEPKEETPVVETKVEVIKSDEPENNFLAYGISYNEEMKKFMLFTIEYNPVTKTTKMINVEPYADSGPTALNKLNRVLSLRLLKREEKY